MPTTHDPIFDPKADSPLSDEALRSKRDRYAHFKAKDVVARIAKRSLKAGISRVEPLGIGATNAFDHLVFRAHTDKGLRVVFRLNTDALIAEEFLTEAMLYDTWHKAGIPSPEVYDVTLRNGSDNFDYMLLEHVGTHDIEEYLRYYPHNRSRYAYESGKFLRRLHTVPLEGFGMLVIKDGVLRGIQKTWREALHTRLEETLKYLVHHNLLTSKQEKEIQKAFTENENLLVLENGVALHGDYHNANILIDEVSEKVVAAIDISQAKAGDPIYDIAFYGTYVSPEIFGSFCEGYFDHGHPSKNFERKLALYQLRIYLSKAKLRKRFGYEERIGQAVEGILQSLKKLL